MTDMRSASPRASRLALALLAPAVCLVSCGGAGGGGQSSSSAVDGGLGCSNSGTVTVSGALTGTRAVNGASGLWYSADDVGYACFAAIVPESPFMAFGGFSFPGEPRPGTYSASTSGINCALDVALPGTSEVPAWGFDTTYPDRPQGTCTLELTSVTTRPQVYANARQYCVRGSLMAELPPNTYTQGTVTLTASF